MTSAAPVESPSSADDAEGDRRVGTAQRQGTLAICCLAALLLAIDGTVLSLAIPALTLRLNPSANQILWIADVYGFVLGGLLIPMGNLGDRIGRKRLLLFGVTAFGLASAATAFAPTPELLIAARAVLGVAGATVMPSTLSILRNVYTDPVRRSSAIGLWSGTSIAGFALGPIVGGVLLEHFWWGSVFLVNVPVCAGVVVAGLLVLPESRNPRPGRIDLPSVALAIVGIVSLSYAVKESVRVGVLQSKVLLAIGLGVGALCWFVRRQPRLTEPLIDLGLFRRREYAVSVGASAVTLFLTAALGIVFAQYFQLVLGWSQLRSGLAGLPGALCAVVGGALAARATVACGPMRVIALGLGGMALGCALYLPVGIAPNYWLVLAPMVVFGVGAGLTVAATNDTLVAAFPPDRAGAAAAISETAFEVGGALGIALIGSVLNAVYRTSITLPTDLPADQVSRVRESLGTAITDVAARPEQAAGAVVDAARAAFVDGVHVAALVCAVLAAVLTVPAVLALRRPTPNSARAAEADND